MEQATNSHKSTFTLRNVRLDDVDQIMKINRLALPENYPYYFFVEHVKDYDKAFYVAVIDGDIVGYIMP